MVWNGFNQRTVSWKDGKLVLIDQTRLPNELSFIECTALDQVVDAIHKMSVRGAPAIGATAAFGLALVAQRSKAGTKIEFFKEFEKSSNMLKETRPTAVNLFWAVERMMDRARSIGGELSEVKEAVIDEAIKIAEEDVEVNHSLGRIGAGLIESGDTVLTHCK